MQGDREGKGEVPRLGVAVITKEDRASDWRQQARQRGSALTQVSHTGVDTMLLG